MPARPNLLHRIGGLGGCPCHRLQLPPQHTHSHPRCLGRCSPVEGHLRPKAQTPGSNQLEGALYLDDVSDHQDSDGASDRSLTPASASAMRGTRKSSTMPPPVYGWVALGKCLAGVGGAPFGIACVGAIFCIGGVVGSSGPPIIISWWRCFPWLRTLSSE